MDFLDSVDFDVPTYKKSRRVRSWYLYEQFKSLERNQLDAAQKLKNRSYQDKLLQQEMSERRARRKLYDQFEVNQSESGIECSLNSEVTKTSLNASTDDFFESFHELQEEESLGNLVAQDGLETCSQDKQQVEQFYIDDFKSAEEPKGDQSSTESVTSVVNAKCQETITEDVKKYLEIEKGTKFEDIELNFDEVKQKLQCLERLAQMRDYDKVLENEGSLYSMEEVETKHITMKDKNVNTPDNNIYFMWSKLVSFAYQLMQLNHGNCYYDYGSQLLTAVLACDVLRRGISRMCHILQPCVSPIKFATDLEFPVEIHKNTKRKRPQKLKQPRKAPVYKRYCSYHSTIKPKLKTARSYQSENFWAQHSSQFSGRNKINYKQFHGTSEPARSQRNPSYQTIWPISSHATQKCNSCHKVVNPMLRLSRYLDRLMRDIEEPLC